MNGLGDVSVSVVVAVDSDVPGSPEGSPGRVKPVDVMVILDWEVLVVLEVTGAGKVPGEPTVTCG